MLLHTLKETQKNLKLENYTNSTDLSNLRLTIDEQIDCEMIEQLTNLVKNKYFFGIKDVEKIYKKNSDLFQINNHIKRDEGF